MDKFFRYLLTGLLCLVAAMECIQVLLRYILHMPIIWLDETIIFPAIWLYMLGAANASRENTQIVAKILPVIFPKPRQVAFFDLCSQLFSVVISLWLTWYGLEYLVYAWKTGRHTGYLFVSMFIGESALGIGMVIITAYTLVWLKRSAMHLLALYGKGEGNAD